MDIDPHATLTTLGEVEAGQLIFMQVGPTLEPTLLGPIVDNQRSGVRFPRRDTSPGFAIAFRLNMDFTRDEECLVVSDVTLRPDQSSLVINPRVYMPIGALLHHATNGLCFKAEWEQVTGGTPCYSMASLSVLQGVVGGGEPYYSRWSIVVPNGPIAETAIVSFDADINSPA